MLSAIGGTSASYVRSDMSGDSSVKHKGGIKNNYGETASGSNGVSVPVRTSPNANISLRGGGRADLGDQGCRDGTMAGTTGSGTLWFVERTVVNPPVLVFGVSGLGQLLAAAVVFRIYKITMESVPDGLSRNIQDPSAGGGSGGVPCVPPCAQRR